MIFKSKNLHDNQIYDEAYFRQLGKDLAKKSISNLKKELKEISDI
ncbi:hypothetical protein [Methanobrevibacter sp.]|nr:hypothetical protein [Methanobrevibacter sp.]MDO5859707.1 hypothetical protein [Methanobrevibacter sp.]